MTFKKKAKGTKKCVIIRELMLEKYEDCLLNSEVILNSQQRFNSDHDKVYTEVVNKTAFSSDDDKKLQTFDRVTTYPQGTTNEMMTKKKYNETCYNNHKYK